LLEISGKHRRDLEWVERLYKPYYTSNDESLTEFLKKDTVTYKFLKNVRNGIGKINAISMIMTVNREAGGFLRTMEEQTGD